MSIRRESPEPPWGGPEIRHTPGVADDLMREIAPMLAEDGINLDDPESIPDIATLQRALDSAIERRNMQLFTPVGEARALALTTLRLFVEAIAAGQAELAEAILATAVPESPDGSQATVAGTIGVALDLLDSILSTGHPDAPAGVGARERGSRRDTGSASVLGATSSTLLAEAAPSARWAHSSPGRGVRPCRRALPSHWPA